MDAYIEVRIGYINDDDDDDDDEDLNLRPADASETCSPSDLTKGIGTY
jgi:hypothetical protein